MTTISASVASFLVACTMLFVLRPFAEVIGLVDKPGGRKTHHGEVPVVGGIAMFSGLVIAAVGGEGLGHGGLSLLVVAAFMVFIGALDDRFNLPPGVRLFAHLSSAFALVYATRFSVPSLGDLFSLGQINLGIFAVPFTVIATVALINAFNMLDGLDGLAGTVGMVAFGGVMFIAARVDAVSLLLVAGSMFGAILAFLLFNFPVQFNRPFRTFMGDAGSTLLGFVLAGLGLTLVQPKPISLSPIVILWLMPIPIFELFTSTIRRLVKGMPPMQADSGHFHHVLVKAGFSVRAICAIYLLVSATCCSLGVWASGHPDVSDSVLFAGFVAIFAIWLAFIRASDRLVAYLPVWLRRVDAS
ncbi:MAG: MraY family glycosyltransferase [Steroidobacteraceae bacterium]